MTVEARYDLTDDHVEQLRSMYRGTWFGSEWSDDTVTDLLAGTDEHVALVDADGDLLAFAHVLTDYATVAFVRDVVVRESRRGEGLGRRLLEELRSHPALEDVSLAVTCPTDLAPFYESCGFSPREDGAILVDE